jgi:Putative zinc-finger
VVYELLQKRETDRSFLTLLSDMHRHSMDHDLAVKSQACEKYLLGELSPDLRDAYEEHYFSCAECATQLRMAAELVGAGQQIFAQTPAVAAGARIIQGSGGWLRWLRPAIAIPVLATLLLVVGYQNLVMIPQLKESRAPRVLPMFSLISANTRGETVPAFTTQPNQPLGLYVDVPADAAYSTYVISVLAPSGRTTPLRSLSYAEAQKTQVVVINPEKMAGKYTIVISGQTHQQPASTPAELARVQFTVAFSGQVQQH